MNPRQTPPRTIQPGTSGNWVQIGPMQLAASASSVDFQSSNGYTIDSTYDEYRILGTDVVPASTSYVGIRVGTGSGGTPTYQAGTNYENALIYLSRVGGVVTAVVDVSVGMVYVLGNTGVSVFNNVAQPGNFDALIQMPGSPSVNHVISHTASYRGYTNADQGYVDQRGTGAYLTNAAVTALRVIASTGNISGTFSLYGRKKPS